MLKSSGFLIQPQKSRIVIKIHQVDSGRSMSTDHFESTKVISADFSALPASLNSLLFHLSNFCPIAICITFLRIKTSLMGNFCKRVFHYSQFLRDRQNFPALPGDVGSDMPLSSSSSIMRAALLYPMLSFLCRLEVEARLVVRIIQWTCESWGLHPGPHRHQEPFLTRRFDLSTDFLNDLRRTVHLEIVNYTVYLLIAHEGALSTLKVELPGGISSMSPLPRAWRPCCQEWSDCPCRRRLGKKFCSEGWP